VAVAEAVETEIVYPVTTPSFVPEAVETFDVPTPAVTEM
jgi:hypothetical protein